MSDDVAAFKERMLKDLRARDAEARRLLSLWLWRESGGDIQDNLRARTRAFIGCVTCGGALVFDELVLEMTCPSCASRRPTTTETPR